MFLLYESQKEKLQLQNELLEQRKKLSQQEELCVASEQHTAASLEKWREERQQLGHDLTQAQETIAEQKSELEALRVKLPLSEQRNEEQSLELSLALEKLQRTVAQKDHIVARLQVLRERNNDAVRILEAKIRDLVQQLVEQQAANVREVEKRNEETESYLQTIGALRSRCDALEARNSSLERNGIELEMTVFSSMQKEQTYKESIEAEASERKQLQATLQTLETELAEHKRRENELEAEKCEWQAQRVKMEQEIQSLQSQLEECEDKLAQANNRRSFCAIL